MAILFVARKKSAKNLSKSADNTIRVCEIHLISSNGAVFVIGRQWVDARKYLCAIV